MTTIQKLEIMHKRLHDLYPSVYIQHKSKMDVSEQQEVLIKELNEELTRLEADRQLLKDILEAKCDIEQLSNRIYQIKGYLNLLE